MENQLIKIRDYFSNLKSKIIVGIILIISIFTNGIFGLTTAGANLDNEVYNGKFLQNTFNESMITKNMSFNSLYLGFLKHKNVLNIYDLYKYNFLKELNNISDLQTAYIGFEINNILIDELYFSFINNQKIDQSTFLFSRTIELMNEPIDSKDFYEDIIKNLTTKKYLKNQIQVNSIKEETEKIEKNNKATFTKNSEIYVFDFNTIDIPEEIKTEGKFGIIKTDLENKEETKYIVCYIPNKNLSENKIIDLPKKVNADSTKGSKKDKINTTQNTTQTSNDQIAQSSYNESTQTSPVKTASSSSVGTYLGTFTSTAYCNCSICCGKWAGGPTKSGAMPTSGRTIAVDPKVIPLGSKVMINGNIYIAEDTGSAIKGKKIDIYFGSHSSALNYGRRTIEVYLVS